jgi:hypothetical protein
MHQDGMPGIHFITSALLAHGATLADNTSMPFIHACHAKAEISAHLAVNKEPLGIEQQPLLRALQHMCDNLLWANKVGIDKDAHRSGWLAACKPHGTICIKPLPSHNGTPPIDMIMAGIGCDFHLREGQHLLTHKLVC